MLLSSPPRETTTWRPAPLQRKTGARSSAVWGAVVVGVGSVLGTVFSRCVQYLASVTTWPATAAATSAKRPNACSLDTWFRLDHTGGGGGGWSQMIVGRQAVVAAFDSEAW